MHQLKKHAERKCGSVKCEHWTENIHSGVFRKLATGILNISKYLPRTCRRRKKPQPNNKNFSGLTENHLVKLIALELSIKHCVSEFLADSKTIYMHLSKRNRVKPVYFPSLTS